MFASIFKNNNTGAIDLAAIAKVIMSNAEFLRKHNTTLKLPAPASQRYTCQTGRGDGGEQEDCVL